MSPSRAGLPSPPNNITTMPVEKNHRPQALPEPTLRRLPWYLAYVTRLMRGGAEYVSSTQIAAAVGVDSSQIAKDLSFLNVRGKTRIGYEVPVLERELRDFLGFRRSHNAVVIGAGSLGSALMRDSGLHRYGLNIVAAFDIDPQIAGGEIAGIPIYNITRMKEIVPALDVDIAVLTVPVDVAQSLADDGMEAGIRAIWNFTPSRISVREGCVVQNTSLYAHLAVMYNRLETQ